MEFRRCPVGVGGAHPAVAVDGLVGRGGEDQQLVPLVGQEASVNLNRNLSVEWKLPSPVNQLEDNSVSNPTQFV